MSRVNQYIAVWLTLLIIVSYTIYYSLVGFHISKFVADWVALIGVSFMSAATTPVAWRAFRNGIKSDRDRFIFSYWLIWTAILLQRIWVLITSIAERPEYLTQSIIPGLLAMTIALASAYGASAPFSGGIPVEKKELIIFSLAAGFSGIVGGIIIGVYFVAGWVF